MKRTLAILAVIALLIGCFAACKPDTLTIDSHGDDFFEQKTTGSDSITTNPDETTEPSKTQATNNAGSATEATAPGTDNPETTTTEGTTAPAKKPETTQEIVDYFNMAANKVKTEKPGYSWRDRAIIDDKNITCSNRLLNSLAPAVISFYKRFEKWQDKDPVAKGANHSDFPVNGKNWASKLEVSSVKSASCTESGGNYIIKIVLKDEDVAVLPKDPSTLHTGKVMNAWSYGELMEGTESSPLINITGFQTNYRAPSISCKVDKASGNIKSITYTMPAIFIVDVTQFGGTNASLLLTREAEYTF